MERRLTNRTPGSAPNYQASLDAATAFSLQFGAHSRRACEPECSQVVAADGQAGVVRRDAIGLLPWATGLVDGAI